MLRDIVFKQNHVDVQMYISVYAYVTWPLDPEDKILVSSCLVEGVRVTGFLTNIRLVCD